MCARATGSNDVVYAALLHCDGDVARASEMARCGGRPGALGKGGFVNVEMGDGSRAPLLVDTGNPFGLVVSNAFRRKYLPHFPLERPSAVLVDMAGAASLIVLGEVEFEAFMLTKKRGRLRLRTQVAPELSVDWYLSMCEIKAMGVGILTSKKKIPLPASSPPVVLPLYESTDEQILPATGVAASASVACTSAVVQGARLLEPYSVSPVKFKVGEKLVLLRDLLLESGDERLVPVVVDGHRVVVGGGFELPVANETDDPIELEQTTCFSVSTIDVGDGDMV